MRTLCEMKCSVAPTGKSVIKEVEQKVDFLRRTFPSRTVHRVLIVHGNPPRGLVRAGYFYRFIQAGELAAS